MSNKKNYVKKVTIVILMVALLCSIVGCGKKETIVKAEQLISSIGNVSLNSETAINTARTYYETLTDKEKEQVSNYDVLCEAEENYKNLYRKEQERIAEEQRKLAEEQAKLAEEQAKKDAFSGIMEYASKNDVYIEERSGALLYYYELQVEDDCLVCFYGRENLGEYVKLYISYDKNTFLIEKYYWNLNVNVSGKNPSLSAYLETKDKVLQEAPEVSVIKYETNVEGYFGTQDDYIKRIAKEAYIAAITINDYLKGSSCPYSFEDFGLIIK